MKSINRGQFGNVSSFCCFCPNRCVKASTKQVTAQFRPFISIMKNILFPSEIDYFDQWNSLTTEVNGDLCNNCFAQYSINSASLVEFRKTLEALFAFPKEEDFPEYNAIVDRLRAGKCVFRSDVECEKHLPRKLLGEKISSIITSIPCKYESGRNTVELFCYVKGMPDQLVQQWLIGSHRSQRKEHEQEVSNVKAQIEKVKEKLAAERNKKDAKAFLRAVATEFGARVKGFNKQRVYSRMSTPASAEIRTAAAASAAMSAIATDASSSAAAGPMEQNDVVDEDSCIHENSEYSPSDILALFCPDGLRAICPTSKGPVNDARLVQLLVSISMVFSSEKLHPKQLPWAPDMAHFLYFEGLSEKGLDFLSTMTGVCANNNARKYDARKMCIKFDSQNKYPEQLLRNLVCFTSDNVGKMSWSYFKYVIFAIRIYFDAPARNNNTGNNTTGTGTSAYVTTTTTTTTTTANMADVAMSADIVAATADAAPSVVTSGSGLAMSADIDAAATTAAPASTTSLSIKFNTDGVPDMTPPTALKTCTVKDFITISSTNELSLFDKWHVIFFIAELLYHTDMWKTLISPKAFFLKTKNKSTEVGAVAVHYLVRVIAVQMGLGTDLPPMRCESLFLVEAKSASVDDFVVHVLEKLRTSTQRDIGVGNQQEGIFHVGDSEIYKHVLTAAKNDPKYSHFTSLPGPLHHSWALLHAGKTIFGDPFLNPVEVNINSNKLTKVTLNAHRHDLHLLCVAGDSVFWRLVEVLCDKGCFKLDGIALTFVQFEQKIKIMTSFEELSTCIKPWIQIFWAKCLPTDHCGYTLQRTPVPPAVLGVSTGGVASGSHAILSLQPLSLVASPDRTMLAAATVVDSTVAVGGSTAGAADEDDSTVIIAPTMLLMGAFIHYYQWVLAFITSFRICDIGLKHLADKITWYYYFMSGQVTYQILTGRNIYRSLTWPDDSMYQLALTLSMQVKNELRYMAFDEVQELRNKHLTGLARNGEPKHMANTAKILTQLLAVMNNFSTKWHGVDDSENKEEAKNDAAGVLADSTTQQRIRILQSAIKMILSLLRTIKNFVNDELKTMDGVPGSKLLEHALLHNASKMQSLMVGVAQGIIKGGPDPKGTSKNTIGVFGLASKGKTRAETAKNASSKGLMAWVHKALTGKGPPLEVIGKGQAAVPLSLLREVSKGNYEFRKTTKSRVIHEILLRECSEPGTSTNEMPTGVTYYGIDMPCIPYCLAPNWRKPGGGTISGYAERVWKAIAVLILDRNREPGAKITLGLFLEHRPDVSPAKAATQSLRNAVYIGPPRCEYFNSTDQLPYTTSTGKKSKCLDTSDRPTLDAVIKQLVLRLVENPVLLGENMCIDFLDIHNLLYAGRFGSHFFNIKYSQLSPQSEVTATAEYLPNQFLEADHHGEAELKLCSVVLKFAEDISQNAHKNIVVVSVDSDVTMMLQYHGTNIGRMGMNVVRQTALSKASSVGNVYINESMLHRQLTGQLCIGSGNRNMLGQNPARARLLSLIAWFCGCTDYVESILNITPKKLWDAFKVLEGAGVYTFRLTHCSSWKDIINLFLVTYSPYRDASLFKGVIAFNTHFEGTFEDKVLVELRKLDSVDNDDSHFVWVDNNKLATYFDVTLFPYVLSVNEDSSKWPLMWGAIECHCKRVFFNCLIANMLIIYRAELPPLNENTGFYCIDEGVFARCITPTSYLDGKGKIRQIPNPSTDLTTRATLSPPKRRKSASAAASTTASTSSPQMRRKSLGDTATAAAIDDDYYDAGQLETTLLRRKQSSSSIGSDASNESDGSDSENGASSDSSSDSNADEQERGCYLDDDDDEEEEEEVLVAPEEDEDENEEDVRMAIDVTLAVAAAAAADA